MFIVISNDPRIPDDLQGFQFEQWSSSEFFERASSDEGINIDEGLWYDTTCLTKEIYSALCQYKAAGVSIIYYRYTDKPAVDFNMTDNVIEYEVSNSNISNNESQFNNENKNNNSVNESNYTQQPVQNESTEVYNKENYSNDNTIQNNNTQSSTENVSHETSNTVNNDSQANVEPNITVDTTQQNNVVEPPNNDNITNIENIVEQTTNNVVNTPVEQLHNNAVNSVEQNKNVSQLVDGVRLVGNNTVDSNNSNITKTILNKSMSNMLLYDDWDASAPQANRKAAPAKVILFGSSKGGTGKTFTCLISAYWYAKTHPTQRIALADFDIIDGQIGITINKLTPTMQDFYKVAKAGQNDFAHLDNCKVKSDKFSPNIDFYLAPSQDIPIITNDNNFWTDVFKLLITNYDVVFFDSGIDYLGKPPISQLYKIADKIIITCNPSINSVKSVIKQFKTLSGQRLNNIFKPGDDILSRTNVVLTRVYENQTINDLVVQNITKFVPVIAAFGNIDHIISQIQWYQMWDLIDANKAITDSLEDITNLDV